ncbi:hypothetical protein L798_11956 [Zootermopsis nevadensis]|uniref:Uncharacterized protein n=1 Tax=Zootermopsis nevadensis TaxID=136037 RepID=A0A067R496_ZOONE|nr:hypothetical protein L798_11956 [Zootermopsis nevadensis]
MEFIKVEPNTDGEIQPTFFLSDVKEEQDCLALMSTEGVHCLQLINLECDSKDGQHVPITIPPVKTETQDEDNMIDVEWENEVKSQDRAEQLISQLGGVSEGISSTRSVDYQHGYLIHDLHSGDGEEGLIIQPDGTSKGSSSANLDSSIDHQQDCVTSDLCNGNEDELCNIPEGGSSTELDSSVDSQQGYVTCDSWQEDIRQWTGIQSVAALFHLAQDHEKFSDVIANFH